MYVLFGAGEYGKSTVDLIGKDKIAFFLDNDKRKIGTTIKGISIFSINTKKNELMDYTVVITVSKSNEAYIVQQLTEYGVLDYLTINEQFYNGIEAYHEAISRYQDFMSSDASAYYGGVTKFSTKDIFPDQYRREYDLIKNAFLPLMTSGAYIADVGCADGHWANEVSKYCAKVDGYDYSDSLIKTAKTKYENENTHFYKWDARKDRLTKRYDGIILFGLLMYMYEDDGILVLLNRLRHGLKDKGFLLTKDTLNITEKTDVFSYNPITGYSGRYMNQNNYDSFFIRSGFKPIHYSLLMMRSIDEYGRAFISRGTIWEIA